MLNIQKFCKENENWKEILSQEPYNLKIQECDIEGYENLVLFKYNQIASDFNNEIVRECRGLILEKGTWKVVRMAFKKFFNVGESYADKIDWASASATSKEDGSLISLYFYNGWKIASNGNICADLASLPSGKYNSFGELMREAMKKYEIDVEKLNPKYTYTFELCSPYNTIVCKYDEIQLFLILVRDNDTLEEIENENVSNVPRPEAYQLNTEDEYKKFVETFGENREGIVVKDKNNNRVKIKTQLYFHLHKMANNNVLMLERAVEIILANELSEFLAYFPQHTNYINEVKEIVDAAFEYSKEVIKKVENWKTDFPNAERKDFAKFAKCNSFPTLYFLVYDGKDIVDFVTNLNAKQFIKFFDIQNKIKKESF